MSAHRNTSHQHRAGKKTREHSSSQKKKLIAKRARIASRTIPAWLSLDDRRVAQLEWVGGKAQGLHKLIQLGASVPSGVVLTTATIHRIKHLHKKSWPHALQQMLIAALKHVAPHHETVAVRSSGVAEDTEQASFAGQYVTVLNVKSLSELMSAIEKIISVDNLQRAKTYQHFIGQHEKENRIAIVIQRMVHGELSGVVFTRAPGEAYRDYVMIETVQGLGEQLVSGEKAADRILLKRKNYALVEPHSLSEKAYFNLSQAKKVAQQALLIEKKLGKPQDIEFTIKNKKLWLLQARPITQLATQAHQKNHINEFDSETSSNDIWTSHNIQEVVRDVVCPFTSYFFQKYWNQYTAALCKLVVGKGEHYSIIGCFYNRIFLNMNAIYHLSDRILGADAKSVVVSYLGTTSFHISREAFWTRWQHRVKSFIPFLTENVFTARKSILLAEKNIFSVEKKLNLEPIHNWDDKKLITWCHHFLNHALQDALIGHFRTSSNISMLIPLLSLFVPSKNKNALEEMVGVLSSGLTCVDSANLSVALWDLSRLARQKNIAIDKDDFDPLSEALPEIWRTKFRAFLTEYGHRCDNEWDLSAVTWRRNPKLAAKMIAHYFVLDDSYNPMKQILHRKEKRLLLTRNLREKMPLVKRLLFDLLLKKVQYWMALREHTKSVSVRGLHFLDEPIAEMSRRLIKQGLINTSDDIFFLTLPEITQILNGHAAPSYQLKILHRRKEMERNRYLSFPEYFVGYPTPLSQNNDETLPDVITGIPVNAGIITGKARVIRELSEGHLLQPGELLVVHTTDIAWTPLFSLAAAVVVDIGSVLSHGSIVAREFGLPAVVNVKVGTTRIMSGDIITVDGDRGLVRVQRSTS